MTTIQNNILYKSNFDGDLFHYHTKNLLGPILWLFGFKQKLETPVNVVLGYTKRKVSKLTLLELTVNRYRFGQDTPNPICFPPILFMGGSHELLDRLTFAMEKSIRQSKQGLNVGLMNIDVNKIQAYHSIPQSDSHHQSIGILNNNWNSENRSATTSGPDNSESTGQFQESNISHDNPSRSLVICKEISRDAGI